MRWEPKKGNKAAACLHYRNISISEGPTALLQRLANLYCKLQPVFLAGWRVVSEVGTMSTMASPDRLEGCCKSVLLSNKPKPRELAQKQDKTESGSSSSLHITFHKYPQPRPGKLAFGSFFIKWLRFSKWEPAHLLLFFDFISMACHSHQLVPWLPTTKRCSSSVSVTLGVTECLKEWN